MVVDYDRPTRCPGVVCSLVLYTNVVRVRFTRDKVVPTTRPIINARPAPTPEG